MKNRFLVKLLLNDSLQASCDRDQPLMSYLLYLNSDEVVNEYYFFEKHGNRQFYLRVGN